MDYCSSCRRHLNGALVCPGCGAYAPDIAPMAPGGRTSRATATTELWPEPEESPGADAPFEDPEGEIPLTEGAIPLAEGRAARRRQKARWKKNQRRAVVATAVALVGGGLTVSAMNRGGAGGQHTQASATPADVTSMGVAETADQQTDVVPSTGTGKHRKPDTTTGSAANTGTSHGGSSTTATHTDSARTQPYAASTPATAASPSAQRTTTTGTGTSTDTSASTSTSSTSTGTSASTSTSTASDSSGSSSNSSGSTSTASDPSTSTATTSPSGICLLGLVCVS
ncbi:hypothetical protein ABZT17_16785 [Streptomyces sp. NPDC005648]|uniref:SCO2400 family protein n=1 Tax=Streptomyces sp. NPDC005648 TaxID=3157044 RepID=UPI0033BEFD16